MIYSLQRIHPKKMQFAHLLSLCEKMLKQPKKRAAPRGSRVSFAAEIGRAVGGGGDGLGPHASVPPAHTFTSVFRLPFPSGGWSSHRQLTSPSFCLSCTVAQCFSFGVNRFVLHDLSRPTRELSAQVVQPARSVDSSGATPNAVSSRRLSATPATGFELCMRWVLLDPHPKLHLDPFLSFCERTSHAPEPLAQPE